MSNETKMAAGTSRRQLLTRAGMVGAAALGAGMLDLGTSNRTAARAALKARYGSPGTTFTVTDIDILNFALQTEYLEAEFYLRAVTGGGLAPTDLTGTGTQGTVTAPANGPVPFSSSVLAAYANEVAADELEHVRFLRSVLGASATARPNIDFTAGFTTAARLTGIIGGTDVYDPFANDTTFLLAAFLFNDVGPSAYIGAAPYIQNPTYLMAASSILGVEAYHAGSFRAQIYLGGTTDPNIVGYADRLSSLRNAASAAIPNTPALTDEGVSNTMGANIVPTDGNSLAFARGFASTLNILYLNTGTTPVAGGFFPNALNGRIA